MSNRTVRTRFAPSPTGGLHLGGVRTVLFNYLFTKQNNGQFVLRIEDTDQIRFVEGAEEYISETLAWCGLEPDESVKQGGVYGPYRQSERKEKGIYKKYAEELIEKGFAYYAFDTQEELEKMRTEFKTENNPSPRYDATLRNKMRNSLSLSKEEIDNLLKNNTPYVIRIKMPVNEQISFTDMIRGEVHFNTSEVDDKVLLKADGMPTYHLAVVVDDYLMQISHAFRGEEWLPSAPVHVKLWEHLFGLENMPQWAHLPLILKPDGKGKLSKRDGERLGFPVFAMDWTDPRTNEYSIGFREKGFLPEAFINMLALLGWNDGSEQEIFSMNELIQKFSVDRIHKAGAKFNYEKALWFNHEWIKRSSASYLATYVKPVLESNNISPDSESKLEKVIDLTKERCTLLNDFVEQSAFFFKTPETIDISSIEKKWSEEKYDFFKTLAETYASMSEEDFTNQHLENHFKELAVSKNIKPGELMLPLRIMLVGGKFGPHVFEIAEVIGKENSIKRIHNGLQKLKQ